MLKIVIVEPETFTLLGIKGAISQSPDIEGTWDQMSSDTESYAVRLLI